MVTGATFEADCPIGRTGMMELADGRLMAVCDSPPGSGVVGKNYSENDGRSWKSEAQLTDAAGKTFEGVGYGVLRLASGKILACYRRVIEIPRDRDEHGLFCCWSEDDGQTWSSEQVRINRPGLSGRPYYDTMFQLESGRLIQPVRYCLQAKHPETTERGHSWIPEIDVSYVYYSDDEGKSWGRSEQDLVVWDLPGHRGSIFPCDEPSAAEAGDGSIVMAIRTTIGRVAISRSFDEGVNWSMVEASDLMSSYSPSRIRTIPQTGDLLMVFNQVSLSENMDGYRRSRLSSAVSKDNGKTWGHFRTIECCAALESVDRVATEPVQFTQAGSTRGDKPLPAGPVVFRYANVNFLKGKAYVHYNYQTKLGPDNESKTDKKRKLLVVPIEWFYEKP